MRGLMASNIGISRLDMAFFVLVLYVKILYRQRLVFCEVTGEQNCMGHASARLAFCCSLPFTAFQRNSIVCRTYLAAIRNSMHHL